MFILASSLYFLLKNPFAGSTPQYTSSKRKIMDQKQGLQWIKSRDCNASEGPAHGMLAIRHRMANARWGRLELQRRYSKRQN